MNEDMQFNMEERVQIRILCRQDFEKSAESYFPDKPLKSQKSLLDIFYRKPQPEIADPVDLDTIIIHVHGGGYVATSSFSHQVYTRVWAN